MSANGADEAVVVNGVEEGTVIAVHGSLARVQVGDETLLVAARRRLRWEDESPADPRLAVGDVVVVERHHDQGVVVAVKRRRSCLLRRSSGGGRAQVLAANIDLALLVFAALLPEPKQGLLDRFLAACRLAGIEAVVVVNKVDQGEEAVADWPRLYGQLGYTVLRVSARTGRGLGEITRRLVDRTTLFCGPSGVGKSSLLNACYPGFRLKVGSVSAATGKGTHVTTLAELMPLPGGGFVVDTPGLKEFGLFDVSRRELEAAFPEIQHLAGSCRFPNCRHLVEPGCTVLDAVAGGAFDPERYRTYVALVEESGG